MMISTRIGEQGSSNDGGYRPGHRARIADEHQAHLGSSRGTADGILEKDRRGTEVPPSRLMHFEALHLVLSEKTLVTLREQGPCRRGVRPMGTVRW